MSTLILWWIIGAIIGVGANYVLMHFTGDDDD